MNLIIEMLKDFFRKQGIRLKATIMFGGKDDRKTKKTSKR